MRRLAPAALSAAVVAVVLGALSGEALTAGAPAGVGFGHAGVSGYAVSNVGYGLCGETSAVHVVSFDLDRAPQGEVRVRLRAADPWTTCEVEEAHAFCAVGAVRLLDVDRLDVVAASS
jgi:hypothetical protein